MEAIPGEAGSTTFEQCLFGYDDGHALLASSVSLDPESLRKLLPLSDLAPGAVFDGLEGYWTGCPLPALKSYALLKTWPAPEMRRPGCVWTHVILLKGRLFDTLADLAPLQSLFRRPSLEEGFESYSVAQTGSLIALSRPPVSALAADDALLSLYEGSGAISGLPGEHDALFFSLWSQQWPRLRRSFRFRTASVPSRLTSSATKFDLRVVHGSVHEPRRSASRFPAEIKDALIDDLKSQGSAIREHLWRFGRDVKRSKRGFLELARVYRPGTELTGSAGSTLLSDVGHAFPDSDDAVTLKAALIAGGHSTLPKIDHLAIFDFLLSDPEAAAFPLMEQTAFFAEGADFETTLEMARLADIALSSDGDLADRLVDSFVRTVAPPAFLPATRERPGLRFRSLRDRPELLDTDAILDEPVDSFSELLEFIPRQSALARATTDRVIALDRQDFLPAVRQWDFRSLSASVIDILERGENLPGVWVSAAVSDHAHILDLIAAASIRRLSTLLAISGPLSAGEMGAVSPMSWLNALNAARPDVDQKYEASFFVRLFIVALESRSKGRERLIQKTLDPVYHAAKQYDLSWHDIMLLSGILASGGMFSTIADRIVITVVRCFVDQDLDPRIFTQLSRDKTLQKNLIHEATRDKRGQKFIKGSKG